MSAACAALRRATWGSGSGLGSFALVLVLLVAAIGFELCAQSMLSIAKFGCRFLDRTTIWDPVAGEFGALPFIWGTLYSSVLALLHRRRRLRSASPSSSPSCVRPRSAQPLIFLTELLAAIPSIVYGLWGIFVLVPLVRSSKRRCRPLRGAAASSRDRRSASACCPRC